METFLIDIRRKVRVSLKAWLTGKRGSKRSPAEEKAAA